MPGSGWLLSHCGPPPLRLLLDRLEHPAQIERVVTRSRHDLRAEQVRLLFVLAAVFQKRRTEPELAALRDDLAPPATDDGSGNCAGDLTELKALRFGCVGGAVAQQHVAQLVRHHADDLALACSGLEHPAVDEHRAAGQRERVDVLQVHRRERVLEHGIVQLSWCDGDEPFSEPVEVARKCGVGDDGVLLANLCRGLATEFDVLFRRVLVFGSRDPGLRSGQRHRNGDRG